MTELPKAPLFPSDLGAAGADVPHLAGRVLRVDGEALWLADAFATVRVLGVADLDVGDLVVLSVRHAGGDPVLLGVVERHRCEPLAGRGEQSRFIDQRVGSNLHARAHAFAKIRSFFASRGFVEVDTPLLVPSPGLDLHLDAVEASGGYLVTSPEYQMKRLLAAGVPRLFQMSHVFRRDEIGPVHNPEFAMLEWYRAFAAVEEVMRDTELLVSELLLSFGSAGVAVPGGFAPPFARMTVCEAFGRFASVSEEDFS